MLWLEIGSGFVVGHSGRQSWASLFVVCVSWGRAWHASLWLLFLWLALSASCRCLLFACSHWVMLYRSPHRGAGLPCIIDFVVTVAISLIQTKQVDEVTFTHSCGSGLPSDLLVILVGTWRCNTRGGYPVEVHQNLGAWAAIDHAAVVYGGRVTDTAQLQSERRRWQLTEFLRLVKLLRWWSILFHALAAIRMCYGEKGKIEDGSIRPET